MARLQPEPEGLIVKPATDDEDFLGVGVGFSPEERRVGPRQEAGQPGIFAGPGIDAERHFLGHPFQSPDRCPSIPAFRPQRIPVGRRRFRHIRQVYIGVSRGKRKPSQGGILAGLSGQIGQEFGHYFPARVGHDHHVRVIRFYSIDFAFHGR